jgi:sigma-B regulation protein RsbU (phosphoserine phosphatase)
MSTASYSPVPERDSIPSNIHTSCDFIQTLMKLQRAAQLITSTLDLDPLIERVVNDIADSIGCVEVTVWLRDPESDEMVLHGVRGCTVNSKGARMKIGKQGMVGHVAATGEMYYAKDVDLDPYHITCEPETRSAVNYPLKIRGQVIGVLGVDHKERDAFSSDQLHVLEALAGHITVAIENARMFQRERMERELMQREADDARVVQQALFPKAYPLIPGFAFETAWHPAGSLAGDWFDFIDLGEDRLGIVLADVSGKGMPAALLMSATRAILRAVARADSSPSETLARLNHALSGDLPMGKFVTMIYAVLDARACEITVASAGHLRPLLINGVCSFVEMDTGLPLGLGTSSYPEHKIPMKAGTRLLFYTDGITEAENGSEEEYGPARLLEHFLQPDACVNGLIEEVQRFGYGSMRTDDATAVLIRSR